MRLISATFRKIKKNLTTFDYLLILLSFSILTFFFFLFFRKAQYINIRVKVTDQNVLYAGTNPKIWYANRFQIGDVEHDSLGRAVTEIIGVDSYASSDSNKTVYLDLRVRAVYDTRTKLYSVKGKTLLFGTPVRFNTSKITFDGIITEVPDKTENSDYKITEGSIDVLLRGIFSDNSSVDPSIVLAVKTGDKLVSSNGNILAEVTNVIVRQAERVTQTDTGALLLRSDPLYKDGLYTLQVRIKTYKGEAFILDDIPLKIGQWIPLSFGDVYLQPIIVRINK